MLLVAEVVVPQVYEGQVKEEATVERTRELRMGGEARCYTWMQVHGGVDGGVDGGRSHDGVLADVIQGTTD